MSRLTRLSLLVSGLVLLFTAVAAWAIARIGLHPLERIEQTAERIAAGDLTERVPRYRRRTEVGRLAHALNGMLGQIERAFSASTTSEMRLRRFISDASHELRTPVASIRGHAEMWRTGISGDLGTIMTRIESESKRMGDLVDDMLLLAHLDQSRPLERTSVDLLSLATDAVIDTQALQPERPIALDAQPGANPPVVIGDQSRLRQILANLLTNALAHTPVTSPIEVAVRARDHHVDVSVRDSGPGMDPEVLTKVFDRFFRADPSRGRSASPAAHRGRATRLTPSTACSARSNVPSLPAPRLRCGCDASHPQPRRFRARSRDREVPHRGPRRHRHLRQHSRKREHLHRQPAARSEHPVSGQLDRAEVVPREVEGPPTPVRPAA